MSKEKSENMLETIEVSEEQQAARKRRNIAIGLGLAFLVGVFYTATIAKFGPKLMDRPIINMGIK